MENKPQNQEQAQAPISPQSAQAPGWTPEQHQEFKEKLNAWVIPVPGVKSNDAKWVHTAVWLSVANVLFFTALVTAPLSIFFAFKARNDIKANPEKKGKVSIWFVFVFSSFFIFLWLIFGISLLLHK